MTRKSHHISLTDPVDVDYTCCVEPDKVYGSFLCVAHDIGARLNLDPDEIELEEV